MIHFQNALQKKPDFVDVYNKIGFILQNKGLIEEAIKYFQKGLEIEPDNIDSHFNLAFPFLLLGNFEQGWKEYEWRRKLTDFSRREFSQQSWDSSDISGKTILLYAEQGFGDTIQFIRYVPLVAKKVTKIIIECQQQLISLFQNIEGIQQIIAYGEQLPLFDIYCPLLSLPLIFRTTIDTIPAEIPYIKVDEVLLQKWKDKTKEHKSEFKVGLSWAGNPKHKNDRNRSFPLETFAPLVKFDNIVFYSLQKGKGSKQAKNPPHGMKLIDYTDEIIDFSDTAALIMNLDLVISADTAVAHLAGALGKPVWTLLPFVPDWRWMLNREDSPWYPTMRLFRQPATGDWKSVIVNVMNKLESEIKNGRREGD